VQSDPQRALALAERAFRAARDQRMGEAQVAALHALGWARSVLGDNEGAIRTLRRGIRLAELHGDRHGEALLRRTIAGLLAFAGHTRAARREIDTAIGMLTGLEHARSQVHRLAVHAVAHPTDPEVHRQVRREATRALGQLRRRGDALWEARLAYNLGLLFM